jgi:hypothetical protein
MEKEEIDRFLQTLREREAEETSLIIDKGVSAPAEGDLEEKIPETGELPPWAKKIEEVPPSEIEEEKEEGEEVPEPEKEMEEVEEEVVEEQVPPEEPLRDIQEADEQKSLPFLKGEERKKAIRAPSRFSVKLKATVFDLLFVSVLWLITLWLASRVLDGSLFRLISVTIPASLIFYLILVISYFFLFLFFLGETLGDRLFRHER